MWPYRRGKDIPDMPAGVPVWKPIKPRYQPGDHLYCKETWGVFDVDADEDIAIAYKTDPDDTFVTWYKNQAHLLKGKYRLNQWRSGRYMFKAFARIWQEVVEVKNPHQIQDISEEDCIAEGVFGSSEGWRQYPYEACCLPTAKQSYKCLWNQLHGAGAWERNEWVWPLVTKEIER
jgi:hypothetical protein